MTDEARLVFVNAVHYIAQFDGQKPIVRRAGGIATRGQIRDVVYGLTDEGFAEWEKMIDQTNRRRAEMIEAIKVRQANGEEIADWEAGMLVADPIEWDRGRMLEYAVPDTLRAEFGEDWDAYIAHYTSNMPYLYPTEGTYVTPLVVDEDAKALGIANDDIAILDQCVEMLESGENVDVAKRILARYTNEDHGDPAAWRRWLDGNRDRLFFTETGGFKWMVNTIGG